MTALICECQQCGAAFEPGPEAIRSGTWRVCPNRREARWSRHRRQAETHASRRPPSPRRRSARHR